MPTATRSGARVWRRRGRSARLGALAAWLAGTAIAVQCWRFVSGQTVWEFAWDAPEQAADLFARMWPPRAAYLHELWRPLWDTVNIATLGTLLALVIAVPLAFVAARTTTPLAVLRYPALLAIAASRSINSLIWALLLVAILGPGMTAGILAIALRSIGFVAKLLYEAIEEIDPRPVEAITATGAGRRQVLAYGVVPQIAPAFAGIAVFRWDINVREATVLGLVGAGGIGLQLDASVSALQWPQVAVIFALIFALVLLSEALSARARRAVT